MHEYFLPCVLFSEHSKIHAMNGKIKIFCAIHNYFGYINLSSTKNMCTVSIIF